MVHAMGELRLHDRELLEFVYWERLSYQEIALMMGISENAVGIRINRAKKNLRVQLQPRPQSISNLRVSGEESES
jgi:RNA polymerase sigma factor (sigma-70 family)